MTLMTRYRWDKLLRHSRDATDHAVAADWFEEAGDVKKAKRLRRKVAFLRWVEQAGYRPAIFTGKARGCPVAATYYGFADGGSTTVDITVMCDDPPAELCVLPRGLFYCFGRDDFGHGPDVVSFLWYAADRDGENRAWTALCRAWQRWVKKGEPP